MQGAQRKGSACVSEQGSATGIWKEGKVPHPVFHRHQGSGRGAGTAKGKGRQCPHVRGWSPCSWRGEGGGKGKGEGEEKGEEGGRRGKKGEGEENGGGRLRGRGRKSGRLTTELGSGVSRGTP